MRVAVLASGGGTILDAMADAGVPVALVIADRVCGALDVAAAHGLPARCIERTDFGTGFDRGAYTETLADALAGADIDLVVMAGFGTILAPGLYRRYGRRVLNTHPSLLPSFPGWHAVADALAYGVKVTGATVHIAVAEVDAGPILAQHAVPVEPGDTEASLHERIKVIERQLYTATVLDIVNGGPLADALTLHQENET